MLFKLLRRLFGIGRTLGEPTSTVSFSVLDPKLQIVHRVSVGESLNAPHPSQRDIWRFIITQALTNGYVLEALDAAMYLRFPLHTFRWRDGIQTAIDCRDADDAIECIHRLGADIASFNWRNRLLRAIQDNDLSWAWAIAVQTGLANDLPWPQPANTPQRRVRHESKETKGKTRSAHTGLRRHVEKPKRTRKTQARSSPARVA